jgi:ABC-2 type transport system permease protein
MRPLLKLTWLELKIFIREPMGVFGSIGVPVLLFIALTRSVGSRLPRGGPRFPGLDASFLPVLSSLLLALSGIVSLVTIISIYRESGILRRLSATPLRPHTVLTAHVLVKLVLTLVAIGCMVLAGRRYYPIGTTAPVAAFVVALVFTTTCLLSLGFLLSSIVPTARFAQPLASLVLYPMLALSGVFVPIDLLPDALAAVARLLPLTLAAALLKGTWNGEPWAAHAAEIAGLTATFVVCTALSSRLFRWQ